MMSNSILDLASFFLLFFLTYFQLFILMSKKYITFANHSEIIISS